MAKFTIKLLTSRLGSNNSYSTYLETPISDFLDPIELQTQSSTTLNKKHGYCYTFNEKISLHQNGQKELSFSMMKNIWLDSEMTTNPFVGKLKNGSQILLIDQYDNEYFFTVTNIKYTLKNSNIVYNYSCQDSFSYQHIRQHNGYTIENNPEDVDFIGAKSVDWWVINKIKPECHISYQYIPLDGGLYLSKTTNNLTLFNKNSSLKDVKKIIKPVFDKTEYPEFFEEIPFSLSGSNASSALISLADEMGLMLNFTEHNVSNNGQRTEFFIRYFWFEPKKNEKNADLKYSPYTNVQTFDFSHKGSSLTTILNVESNTINDEIVSLIPAVTPFFSSLFASSYWDSSEYSDGFFTSICQEKTFLSKGGAGSTEDFRYSLDITSRGLTTEDLTMGQSFYDPDEEYLYLAVMNTAGGFKFPEFYDRLSFFNDIESSEATIDHRVSSARFSNWSFVVQPDDIALISEDTPFIEINDSYSLLPKELMGETRKYCYVKIKASSVDVTPVLEDVKIFLSFYRDVSEEDLLFAEAADACPWLESKLIDFSYFLSQKILSKAEYNQLMNSLSNDLRIINGKLLYYSNQYYRAIHQKTEQLANLINTLDSLGAAFTSDVVETYKTNGSIKNVDYFQKAYSTYQTKYLKNAESTLISGYEDLLTDYFNKSFSAQQRFFKGVYNFKKLFNEKFSWGSTQVEVCKSTLTLKPTNSNINITTITDNNGVEVAEIKRYFSFNEKPKFELVDSNFKYYDSQTFEPLKRIYEKDRTTQTLVVHKQNCTDFYTNTIDKGSALRCDVTEGYSNKQLYYRVAYKAAKGTTNWPSNFDSNGQTWYKYKTDEKDIWYSNAKPNSEITEWPETIQYNGISLEQDFVLVSYQEIVNEYIYNKLYKNNKTDWYYHDINTDAETKTWWHDTTIDAKLSDFQPTVFGNSFSETDWDSPSFTQLIHNIKTKLTGTDSNETDDERVNFYKSHFPIKNVNYIGPGFTEQSYEDWNGKERTYQLIGKSKQTLTSYINYLKDSIVHKKENLKEVLSPLKPSEYPTYQIPIVTHENESEFYRRVPKGGAVALGGMALSFGLLTSVLPFPTKLITLQAYIKAKNLWESNTKWAQSGINTKDFYNDDFDENSTNYTGYHDSNSFCYVRSESAYDEWCALEKYRNDLDEGVADSKKGEIADVVIETTPSKTGWNLWDSIVDSTGFTYYLLYKTHKNKTDYFNFYSKIALTYSKARSLGFTLANGRKITFKDGYLRPVVNTEYINKKYSYRVLLLKDETGKNIIFKDNVSINSHLTNGRLSKIKYYFLLNNSTPIDLTDVDSKGSTTWSAHLKNSEYSNYIFTKGGRYFIIFQEEDFNRVSLYDASKWSNGLISAENRYKIYSNKEVHQSSDATIVDFKLLPGLVEGFYRYAKEDGGFIPINENQISWEGENKTKFFTYSEDNGYQRAYSIHQIIELGEFYHATESVYEEETLNEVFEFHPHIYLHQEYYDLVDDNYQLNTDPSKTHTTAINATFSFDNITTAKTEVTRSFDFYDDEGNIYTRQCSLKTETISNITDITKGKFWCLYHSKIDNPILFEEAAAIETQLTQHWQQAYSASLYCDYFLPESWQMRTNGDTNHYNKNIIIPVIKEETITKTEEDGTVSSKKLSYDDFILSNMYLPDVEIYSNGLTTKFPKWQIEYTTTQNKSRYSLDSTEQRVNPSSDTLASEVLSNCIPYVDLFNELGETMNNFIITNNDVALLNQVRKETLYYNANPNTGVKWKDFIQKHSNITGVYNDYSGLHIMAYRILKNQFKNRPTSRYESYKNKQQILWDNLYRKYPGILLEDSFSNPDATTPQELYLLATNTFLDKQEPERSYNISLINSYNDLMIQTDNVGYKKYQGQELKIGEGILLDVDDYYDNYDDIYRSMSQYLFITDISYDLRRNDNVQLTVNNIKYQDKLIQRLAKLIK